MARPNELLWDTGQLQGVKMACLDAETMTQPNQNQTAASWDPINVKKNTQHNPVTRRFLIKRFASGGLNLSLTLRKGVFFPKKIASETEWRKKTLKNVVF